RQGAFQRPDAEAVREPPEPARGHRRQDRGRRRAAGDQPAGRVLPGAARGDAAGAVPSEGVVMTAKTSTPPRQRLTLATRGSQLALWQADYVTSLLAAH